MNEIIAYILIALIITTAVVKIGKIDSKKLQSGRRTGVARTNSLSKRNDLYSNMAEQVDATYNIGTENNIGTEKHSYTDADLNTISLIGLDAFKEMSARIDRILHSHRGDKSISVTLTCGPSDTICAARLHTLLPGDSISLKIRDNKGVNVVDVFADDMKIGSLVLTEADAVISTLESNRLTGCYVAEQNCYASPGILSMSIIIFYKDLASPSLPYSSIPFDICAN